MLLSEMEILGARMIGIIGCGNMASAIVKGFYSKNNEVKFLTYTPSYTRAETLALEVNGEAVKELSGLSEAGTIVIACKPQQLGELAKSIEESSLELKDKYIISILAATSIETIQKKLNVSRVTRVMPNTPALIGEGMSLVIHGDNVLENEKEIVDEFFSSCGEIALMPSETIFDQVTTVSGSGPAYVFLFANTMAQKLASWGISEKLAKEIVIQLFKGSSDLMADQNGLTFEKLIANVTSKRGVTIEAVDSYKDSNLEEITSIALDAAYLRSVEIEKSLKS